MLIVSRNVAPSKIVCETLDASSYRNDWIGRVSPAGGELVLVVHTGPEQSSPEWKSWACLTWPVHPWRPPSALYHQPISFFFFFLYKDRFDHFWSAATLYEPSRPLRSSGSGPLGVRCKHGETAFSYFAPHENCRSASTLTSFKSRLNTFRFAAGFHWSSFKAFNCDFYFLVLYLSDLFYFSLLPLLSTCLNVLFLDLF